jgi:hypothetical protein
MQVWTDYSTVGYSLLLSPDKMITVEPDRVTIKGGQTFGCIDCEVGGLLNLRDTHSTDGGTSSDTYMLIKHQCSWTPDKSTVG